MKRTSQITVTFPEKKAVFKNELDRLKIVDNLNVSSYVVSLIENDLGYLPTRNK